MSYWDSSFSRYGERGRRPEVGSKWTHPCSVGGKRCSRQIVLTYVPECNGRLRFDYVKSRKDAPDWGTISLMSWVLRRRNGRIKPVRAKTSPKERGPRKPTKKQMIQFCRDAAWATLKGAEGAWSFEFAAYRDEAHNHDARVAGGYGDSIAGDILEWSSLREYVAPGRVIDVFIYRRWNQHERELWDHCLITLPTERATYEAGGAA